MLEALRSRPELEPLLPFARQFYGAASCYVWTDDAGADHEVLQAEGGEQGDPLMPALYALAQHAALADVATALVPGEAVLAFLDDTYIVCSPERVAPLYGALSDALWARARVQLNQGKTRVWNAAGEEPPNLSAIQPQQGGDVWVGAWSSPPERQGLVVLGAPLGSAAFVRQHLQEKRRQHNTLLQRIPALSDLQSAWLLLVFCASPRANYLLRMLPPNSTTEYAREHDGAVAACLSTLLYGDAVSPLPAAAASAAHLPLGYGGLGLRSAAAAAPAAYWASWQDSLPALLARLPTEAEQLLASLNSPHAGMPPALAAACSAAAAVRQAGFPTPLWGESSAAPAPHLAQAAEETLRGWQRAAASAGDERAFETHLSQLDPASRALLLSQAGPHAARAFTAFPTSPAVVVPSAHLRVLLLRRLRLPLPCAPRTCSCHGRLDQLGDHRSACATSGFLASRALPLEHAVARVCREAGAQVARNVRVGDMNIDVPVSDARRIEVVTNGLPLWHGAQLAIDATIVSPVTRTGSARPGADTRPAAAGRTQPDANGAKPTQSSRARDERGSSYSGLRLAGASASFLRLLAQHRAASVAAPLRAAARAGWVQRWSGMLAVAAMRAYAASLLELPPAGEACVAGEAPELHEILADVPGPPPPDQQPPSRRQPHMLPETRRRL